MSLISAFTFQKTFWYTRGGRATCPVYYRPSSHYRSSASVWYYRTQPERRSGRQENSGPRTRRTHRHRVDYVRCGLRGGCGLPAQRRGGGPGQEAAQETAADGAALVEAVGFRAKPGGPGGATLKGIVELADDRDASLIVLGCRGRRTPVDVLFGSVARAVDTDTRRPVLIVCSRN